MNKSIVLLAALVSLSGSAYASGLCSDAYGMQGRAIKVTLTPSGSGSPIVLRMEYQGCDVMGPREENDSPYERRAYKTKNGAAMSLATGIGAGFSSVYLTLSDGRSASIDGITNIQLVHGITVNKDGVLLVKGVNSDMSGGSVTTVKASIDMAPPPLAKSCTDASELEDVGFIVTAGGKSMTMEYAGCDVEPRNDYLPAYTERDYKAADGSVLAVTTNDGAAESDVVLQPTGKPMVQLGKIANKDLVSGKALTAGSVTISSQKN